jgi:UDP-glucuronate 4-epimerase
MRILVTGAAGFIGSHLCEALIKDNQIFGIDNFCDYYSPEVKKNNIEKLLLNDSFNISEIDIRDVEALEEFFNKHVVDVVIHLAAMAGVRPSIIDPVLYTEVNINGTVNLLEQCKKHNVKKFVFASSSSVYGNNKKTPFTESDVVDFPISPYASTKKAGELICYTYHHLEAMSIACLRFFTVYGPRQRPDLAIHKFAKKIQNNETIDVYGDGSSRRDYTYITDILDGIVKAVKFIQTGNKFEVFNLGESQTISLSTMIETIENAMGIKANKNVLPMQPGDVYITYADITKSRKMLGYSPSVCFEEGITKFVNWLN